MPERRCIDFTRYAELFRQVEQVLAELTRDAESHGFDVSPYLVKLAELELFDWPRREDRKDLH